MKVLIVGSGGREHALAWKLRQSPLISQLFVAPGNPGMSGIATLVPHKETAIDELVQFAQREQIDLTVVGPEVPLSLGVVDRFQEQGLRIFGPTKEAARLESSKEFSKSVMREAGVPTAEYTVCATEEEARRYCKEKGAPLVLKADGLAAGKGVVVCHTMEEIEKGLHFLFQELKADRLVIEEFLSGREASFFVATDGRRIAAFPSAHDYKRIYDGNRGPNTGGMGAISPTPYLTPEQERFTIEKIVTPMLEAMERRGTPFRGFLYTGLILPEGRTPMVIEFNSRFGDPECQAIMRRLASDLFPVLFTFAEPSDTSLPELSFHSDVSVCVNLASEGYPASSSKGDVIVGLQEASQVTDVVVFHAGTALTSSADLVTNGGRVLSVTALGADVGEALTRAYMAVDAISFRGSQVRRDIGGPNG